MDWQLRWGSKESQSLFKAMRDDGIHHPADGKQPALRGDCIEYHDAFCLLGASRNWNQGGPLPIPTSEILSLAKDGLGIEDIEERMKFVRLMRRMDQTELTYLHSKVKK